MGFGVGDDMGDQVREWQLPARQQTQAGAAVPHGGLLLRGSTLNVTMPMINFTAHGDLRYNDGGVH